MGAGDRLREALGGVTRLSHEIERSRALSLSNHRLFGALSRIGNLILEATRAGGEFRASDIFEIIDEARSSYGKSSAVEFVRLLDSAICPQCGDRGEDADPSSCDWCESRETFLAGQREPKS